MVEATDHNALLRNDVKMLGNILGDILQLHGGKELFDKVENIRIMTKRIRTDSDEETYHILKKEISQLEPPMRQQVIRAFSIYFHLINIAEQNHRIRRRRQYLLEEDKHQAFSLEEAVLKAKDYNLSNTEIQDVLEDLSVKLIMTAHPTEATKRTVLEIQKRISGNLRKLDNPLATEHEKAMIRESLFNEVTALWHTDELRKRKPEVLDEVKNGLYYFDQTLFDTLPNIFHDMEVQLREHISEEDWHVPNFISFGSWIGGDRDGNPNVTSDITWETLEMQRKLILKKYDQAIVELMRRFSQSSERISINPEFIRQMEIEEKTYMEEDEKWPVESEVYRRKFAVILKRLRETGKSANGYPDAQTLAADLKEIKKNAESHLPTSKNMKTIRKVIRQVEMFGFHLATLDIRNHSGEHEAAIDEILRAVHVADHYTELSEDEKQKI